MTGKKSNVLAMTVKLDDETTANLETFWRKNMYRTRSEFISDAISKRMEAVPCEFCGALNPKGGRICSVCLRPLTIEDEVHTIVSVTNLHKPNPEDLED